MRRKQGSLGMKFSDSLSGNLTEIKRNLGLQEASIFLKKVMIRKKEIMIILNESYGIYHSYRY